jgi:hypothetical protein
LLPGRHTLLLTIASCCSVALFRASITFAFAVHVDGWLLCSLPTQQHTTRITKLKTFPVSTLLDLF